MGKCCTCSTRLRILIKNKNEYCTHTCSFPTSGRCTYIQTECDLLTTEPQQLGIFTEEEGTSFFHVSHPDLQ